jgi:hypothetical protein
MGNESQLRYSVRAWAAGSYSGLSLNAWLMPAHVYEVRPPKDHRGADLISDPLPFGRLWYVEVSDAIEYAKHHSTPCCDSRLR